ncbi:MAG TPA: ABC transporter substrate-binding protein [Ilumatobacteraceae bacterium]|nr:ABC transporter substrate-binding protein [Ilumatobacteraceae bacterium]
MNKRWLKLAAVPVALSLVAAACGDDDDNGSGDTGGGDTETTEAGGDAGGGGDFGGATVTITGPERDDPSIAAIQDTLAAFGESVNINIEYTGDADWEANINTQVEGGNPPNISIFPQPGKLADFARAGDVIALTDEVNATIDENWSEDFQIYGEVDGTQYGVPVKTDLKSLVWYQPDRFEADGYEVPETFDEFVALVEEMAAAGGPKPLCVGIESGQATGWTFTDWTEEMVLRQHGGDVYDQWVSNEIPFDDPQIVESMQTVVDLWSDDNVFASGGSIAATNFGDNAQPLVDGDCYMHRQASFFAGFFPEGTAFADGSDGAIDVFYFPDINGDRPTLTAGTYAAAFDDEPATMAVLNYMATSDYAETRQAAQTEFLGGGLSGFLSAAQGQDPSVYQPLEQGFLEILNTSELSRFDASDLMPADVGAGTFWSEGTSLVNGDVDAATAAARIQESWPS